MFPTIGFAILTTTDAGRKYDVNAPHDFHQLLDFLLIIFDGPGQRVPMP